jgi:hypothetical protein
MCGVMPSYKHIAPPEQRPGVTDRLFVQSLIVLVQSLIVLVQSLIVLVQSLIVFVQSLIVNDEDPCGVS